MKKYIQTEWGIQIIALTWPDIDAWIFYIVNNQAPCIVAMNEKFRSLSREQLTLILFSLQMKHHPDPQNQLSLRKFQKAYLNILVLFL